MPTTPTVVFDQATVPCIESPDGTMRDSVMVTEATCGSQQFSAGLFFVRPGTRGHADQHEGQEEVYYIIAGRGLVVIDDQPHQIEGGDVVFIPDGSSHYLVNTGDQTLSLFWAIAKRWSDVPEIQRELARWHRVEPTSAWGAPR